MRKTRLFCIAITIFLFLSFIASAQNQLKLIPNYSLKNKKPPSLFTIEKAFNEYLGSKNVKNDYYKNGTRNVEPGLKLFEECDWYWERRMRTTLNNIEPVDATETVITPDYSDINETKYIEALDKNSGSIRSLCGRKNRDNSSIGILKYTDGGGTWTNISRSLQNHTIQFTIQNKRISASYQLFVGTKVGVYAKDGFNNLISFNDDLPDAGIIFFQFYYDAADCVNDRLYAGFSGREFWRAHITEPLPVELTNFNAVALQNQVKLNRVTATEVNSYGFDIECTVVNNHLSKANLLPESKAT